MKNARSQYVPKLPASKYVLAENLIKPELNKSFTSIGELARHLKGDRSTIRNYISGKSTGLYRNQLIISLTWFPSSPPLTGMGSKREVYFILGFIFKSKGMAGVLSNRYLSSCYLLVLP
jgi:hypothetical protein